MIGRIFFDNGQCTMHNCITHQIIKWKWGLLGIAGTTCATILTRAIFMEGCKSVAAGMNAMDLRRGISMAVDSVVTNLKSRARMISTSEEIAQVCSYFWSGPSGLVSWTDSSMSFKWFYIEESLIPFYCNFVGRDNICKWRKGNWWVNCQGHGESWQGGCDHHFGKSVTVTFVNFYVC